MITHKVKHKKQKKKNNVDRYILVLGIENLVVPKNSPIGLVLVQEVGKNKQSKQ
jgi:hypothetical protein